MKFIEIDGVKYKEDPANAGQPLKDETTGEPVAWTDEDQAALDAEAGAGETDDERTARETREANVAAGLNEDGSAKTPAPAPVAGEEGNKGPKVETKKDTLGVITLASALDHLDFIRSMFEMNGKDVAPVVSLMEECKALIAKEAGESEKGMTSETLTKVLGSELSKVMAPLLEKVEAFGTDLAAVKADVEVIKTTKTSPRPQGRAVPVEKVIENAAPAGTQDTVKKREELEAIAKEIDTFAVEMGDALKADPSRNGEFMKKSIELNAKYRNCQRELNEMLAGNGGM